MLGDRKFDLQLISHVEKIMWQSCDSWFMRWSCSQDSSFRVGRPTWEHCIMGSSWPAKMLGPLWASCMGFCLRGPELVNLYGDNSHQSLVYQAPRVYHFSELIHKVSSFLNISFFFLLGPYVSDRCFWLSWASSTCQGDHLYGENM